MQEFVRIANSTQEMWVDRRQVVTVTLARSMSSSQPDSPARPLGWLLAYWLRGDPTRRTVSFMADGEHPIDQREVEARELARMLMNAPGVEDEPF